MRVKKLTKTVKKAIETARIKSLQVDLSDQPKREKKQRGAAAGSQVGVGEIAYKQVSSSGREMKLVDQLVNINSMNNVRAREI